jgi:hypothetical protein
METITAVGFIRNSLRKWCKRFIRGDVILICEREFEAGKVDIFHKYNDDEIRGLKRVPQEYAKIQPLIDAYSLKMDKNINKNKDSNDLVDVGDGIEFDEEYSGSEDEDTSLSHEDLDARMMNEEYAEERRGGYKTQSGRDRANGNPKYAKYNQGPSRPKQRNGGLPIPAQQGTRDMPPSSDSEPDEIDAI